MTSWFSRSRRVSANRWRLWYVCRWAVRIRSTYLWRSPLARDATGTPPTTDRRDPYRWFAGAFVLVAVGLAIRQPWSADFGMHAATVERLRTSFTHPGNPLVDADTPSAYYSPYTVLLAAVARLTGLSAVTVLWIAGPVAVALLLVGLR